MEGFASTKLPKSIRSSIIRLADALPLPWLLLLGVLSYVSVIVLVTCVDLLFISFGCQVVKQNGVCVTNFSDLLCFNATTILTIGFGDLVPIGLGRVLAAGEAIAGAVLFGLIIGMLAVKLMLPRRNAIVFSSYCYFDESAKRFIVQFVNTMDKELVIAEMCSLLKIGRGDWIVSRSFTAPYVGGSAWTFSVNSIGGYDRNYTAGTYPNNNLPVDLTDQSSYIEDDGIKFGISGNYGFATFSVAMKYKFDEVWVVPSKDSLPLSSLRKRDLKSRKFIEAFYYIPPKAVSFVQYAEDRGAIIRKG